MKVKAAVRLFCIAFKERILIRYMQKNEMDKFKDPRRVEIYSKVVLSREQKKQIDSLYKENYGKKIPYTWHRHFTAFTGKFDVNYFPELLYIPEFEHFMNLKRTYVSILDDKNILQYLASAANVKMPRMFFSCVDGFLKDSLYNDISREEFFRQVWNLGECFFKPTIGTCSGSECQVLDLREGVDTVTGKSIVEIFSNEKNNWIIQERLSCHDSIKRIYPKSVNTFRVITYRWKNSICHMPAIMRIGRGGANIDNAHAGGIFIAVGDDGVLHEKAFTEFKNVFISHPDTGVVFDGYQIEGFPKVLASAAKCHSMLPQMGCLNWDFTIDENGNPVLIEANVMKGSVWLIEMAHGCGAFGNNTPAVLKWLNKIKKAKYADRDLYMFGNDPNS